MNKCVIPLLFFFYSSGFFITVSADSMLKVSEYCVKSKKPFALNLSAPFIPQFFSEPLLKVLANSALLFGNETEAEAISEQQGWATKDIKTIAQKLAAIPFNGEGSRTVVITQGSLPVVVVESGATTEFPVEKLTAEQIVDTNGAGDAFVGGYLAQLVLGKDLATRVRCGIWAGTTIIQQSGCTVPAGKCTFQ